MIFKGERASRMGPCVQQVVKDDKGYIYGCDFKADRVGVF